MNNYSIREYSTFGFSGSRAPSGAALMNCRQIINDLPKKSLIIVGDAKGIDTAVIQFAKNSEIYYAEDFGTGKSSFARRSVAVVERVRDLGGLWVSFPSGVCPSELSPSPSSSRCFCGSGSGSWASLAFAAGVGLPCLVFASSVPSWGFEQCGFGWWFRAATGGAQLSLF